MGGECSRSAPRLLVADWGGGRHEELAGAQERAVSMVPEGLWGDTQQRGARRARQLGGQVGPRADHRRCWGTTGLIWGEAARRRPPGNQPSCQPGRLGNWA